TGQRAVPVDVGHDITRAAVRIEPGQDLEQLATRPRPAAGGERGAAHVEADGDALPVPGDGGADPVRVLQRRGSDVDARGAGLESRLERLVVADAARELDSDVDGRDHVGNQLAVASPAEGGVEVD